MDLLTIEHQDFTMSIECPRFNDIWGKAKSNVGVENLQSKYSWSEGVDIVSRNQKQLVNGDNADAVFFDNTDYSIWVVFKRDVETASFCFSNKQDNEKASYRKGILASFINFGNDVGKSEIFVYYRVDSANKEFRFGFEVLSTKLDYHNQWRIIVEDIEREYQLLSLDYLRRTFHNFTPDISGQTPDLIWWSIFEVEQNKFIDSCKRIIICPRRKLQDTISYRRADQLKYLPPCIENEFVEFRKEPSHLYRVDERIQSNDTPENRFIKYAISSVLDKFLKLRKMIQKVSSLSDSKIEELDRVQDSLILLNRHPFFRTVGPFKGLSQENLVLQRAVGYSQVYKTWSLLHRIYSLQEGLYRLQTKDVATLYEIWCFIEISHIVRELLNITEQDVVNNNRPELSGLFTWKLGQGERSSILFRKDGVECAELVYNPKHDDGDNGSINMENLVSPTVAQKPDIVLQLSKDDLLYDKRVTYLFDAKYRIKDSLGIDSPPDDAINQMHRYRDAIYYKQNLAGPLKKEVLGGYILFPGKVTSRQDVEKSGFYKSVKEVNIGAFPLRPGDKEGRALLEEFISGLIMSKGPELISESIPQKGLYYSSEKEGESVIVASVSTNKQRDWARKHGVYFLCIDENNGHGIAPDGPFGHARYLIIYKRGEKSSKMIYHLTGKNEVKTLSEVRNDGFPNPKGEKFLSLSFDSQVDPRLCGRTWDLSSEVFDLVDGSPIIVQYSYLFPQII